MLKSNRESVETKLPLMESQVLDLNSVIEKLTKEVEKESRKRSEAIKDRDSILQKYQKL